jgi:hypothetical protein
VARYQADAAFICSIYPGKLPVIRRNYGTSVHGEGKGANRSTTFKLEPVARGEKPFVLPIYDSFEEILDIAGLSAVTNTPKKPRISKPVPVEAIVADLLKEWTGGLFNVPAGAMPGIILLNPMKVELKKFEADNSLPGPNPGELQQMIAQQTAYFEYLFSEGERLDAQKEWKEITDTMKLAADWLGHARTWSHRAIARDSSPCPLCTEIIPNAAAVCPRCHQQIRELPPEIARLNAALRKTA